MKSKIILSSYLKEAMSQTIYDKLDDGTYSGRIPSCKGIIAFGSSLYNCEQELRSTLEDWILLGLKFKHHLPVLAEIDLNKKSNYETVVTL